MAYEKPKEGIKTENNDYINLKGAGQEGSVMQFKIKRYTPLSKLMKADCDNSLEMEAEDTIDTFQQQTGGVYEKGNLLFYSRILFLQTKKTFSIRKL
ncbi:small ubiquitin-related modifier 2-like [Rhinolophus ferrumequinum]|uniref:small ubiquitin-related modifier 2-like n=1 Tax=Rhinolophus ferrumequinum TaxID=59479 RepID=UPI00140F520E|nr:small ubiquitin-related modifier 2-like [Rhinolophus ferrumequinum]